MCLSETSLSKRQPYLIQELLICYSEDVNHHVNAVQILLAWLEYSCVQILHNQLKHCIRDVCDLYHCPLALTFTHSSFEHGSIFLTEHRNDSLMSIERSVFNHKGDIREVFFVHHVGDPL